MAVSERRHELHIRLDGVTFDALQEVARQRGRSMNDLVERCIDERLTNLAVQRLDGPALPAMRQTLDEALRPHVERLAALIVKTHLEAGIAERLTYVLIAQSMGAERAQQFLDAARTRSIEALKRPIGEQKPRE
jgi:hypothetical protein